MTFGDYVFIIEMYFPFLLGKRDHSEFLLFLEIHIYYKKYESYIKISLLEFCKLYWTKGLIYKKIDIMWSDDLIYDDYIEEKYNN